MGNKVASKAVDLLILAVSLVLFVYLLYPATHRAISAYRIEYYKWKPAAPVVTLVNTSKMAPGKAVPILMYHGVTEKPDEANTSLKNFIDQMVWLKQNGYQTISIAEFDQFRQGKLTLPPRPIIITFDDGRKDSYYTTDDVFRQLGFKATIFVASEKAIEKEPFYLSWDELRQMRDSGRWEIEAHGRRSHEKVAISASGVGVEYGRFLTSRMWLPNLKRLETEEEFKTRVEQDYLNNIADLKNELGVTAEYLAIPLNDYGQLPLSNNPVAAVFNQELVRKYFRMAFIEANSSENIKSVQLPIYNYKSNDPYRLRRLEMKNMSTSTLSFLLARERPSDPGLLVQRSDPATFLAQARLDYGYLSFDNQVGLKIRTLAKNASAKVDFGNAYWDNYSVSADLERRAGRSVALIFYASDERNYLSFGLSDNGLFLRARKNGLDTELASSVILPPERLTGSHNYSVVWRDGRISCFFDGELVFSGVPAGAAEGLAGVKVWSDREIAEGVLRSFKITPAPVTGRPI
jgi:peptidoglycan/xylan/chitin deacetylase (PgdA/CDA1 family)